MTAEFDYMIYPEEAFRSWEERRTYYDTTFGKILSDVVAVEFSDTPFILDTAAGEGYGTYLLESAGSDATVVSTDLDPSPLKTDRWLPTDESCMRAVADYTALPFADDSFDGVLSISGVQTHDYEEYREKLDKGWLTETWRVLKPGGKIVLTNDTPRGLKNIFTDPLLMEAIRPTPDEQVIISYDALGDISQPVVLNGKALNDALAQICNQLGVIPFKSEDYVEHMQSRYGEPFFVDLYARAAEIVLSRNLGQRPFKDNSNGGSWNKYYYSQIADDFRRAPNPFRVKRVQKSAMTETEPETIITPNGEELFVSKWRRDSVGNLYVAGLSRELVEIPQVEVVTNFMIAQKVC